MWSYLYAVDENCFLIVKERDTLKTHRVHVPQGHVLAWRGDVVHAGASTPTDRTDEFVQAAAAHYAKRTTRARSPVYNEAIAWAANVFKVRDFSLHGYLAPRQPTVPLPDGSAWEGVGTVNPVGEWQTEEGVFACPW